jgi:leucyl-tRNA synthetase
MGEFLKKNNLGELKTLFRLRDWGVSRQRYWGTPIPMIYCDNCGIVPEAVENLPVLLPKEVDFTPGGGSPLEKCEAFYKTACPTCGGPARRETDTMDTFFDSSWYFFRYTGPSGAEPFDRDESRLWMPPDLYIGGVEHAILHLIYARFFTKVFRDLGWSDVSEPFPHLLTQGMVSLGGVTMSKSRGNVVEPDDMIQVYGADTTRLFILFAAPPEKGLEWSDKGIEGAHRFLQRIWNFFFDSLDIIRQKIEVAPGTSLPAISIEDEDSRKLYIKLNRTIKKVGEDIEQRFHLNTAIAALMEFFNDFSGVREEIKQKNPALISYGLDVLLKMLSPFTPHFCSELWQAAGRTSMLEEEPWPEYDPNYLVEQTVNIMIQVNGKIRDKIVVSMDETEAAVKEAAFRSEKTGLYTEGKQIIKTIFIKNKMLSIVVK